jgi:1-acyl-sn-glycerol-3-phosphate acyltransferase
MSQIQLLKTRRFSSFFWTQFFGAFNDNVLKNALVILVTYKAVQVGGLSGAQMVQLASGIFILPFFLFSATSGQIADKFEKKKIIQWVKFAEIAIMCLATAGFLLHQVIFLFAVLFCMGLHSTVFGPVKYSVLPQLVSENELVGGTALIESGTFLAILLGTITGGLVIAIEPSGPAWVSLVLVGVAVFGFVAALRIPQCPAEDPGLKIEWNPIPPTLSIFRYTRLNRSVFLSVLGISWFWFFGASLLSEFAPYCKEVLHVNEAGVTLLLGIFSVGIALGSLLCERMSGHKLELGLVPFGSIGMSLFVIDLFWVNPPVLPIDSSPLHLFQSFAGIRVLTDFTLLSIFSGFFIVPLYTLIQERTEPSHRSRIIAGNNILNALFMVTASIMLFALVTAKFSIPQIFLIIGVLNAVVACYIYFLLPEFFLRFIAWILAHFLYRIKAQGRENIPATGPAVLVCNHVTFVDWLIIAAAVRRPVRFVMDFGFTKNPFLRILLKQGKVILIATAKEDPKILAHAFEQIEAELKAGELVCIFPEGRITKDGEMNPFKPGIERIIHTTPVPVVPMALKGFWGSFFSRNPTGRDRDRTFWSPIELQVGALIQPENATAESLHGVVASLRGAVR